jgi:biopolymer transport protein ExbD
MRIQGAKKVHYDSGPNMTPLVDVVMVILIFLMLCGSFGGIEHFLASNMPVKEKGGGPAPDAKKPAFEDIQVDVRVDAQSNSNAWTARFGDVTTGDPGKLSAAFKTRFQQYASNGQTSEKLQVIINPNRFVKWKSLITVYQAALQAGQDVYGQDAKMKIGFSTAH